MATDPSIILQAGRGVPPIQSPLEAQAGVLSLASLKQRLEAGQQESQLRQAQLEDRNLLVAQRAREQAGNDALAAAVKKHQQVDQQSGDVNIDYQGVAKDLEASGFPQLASSWLKMQNENAEALDKLSTARSAHAKAQLATIGDLAYRAGSADDFVTGVAIAAAHGLIPEEQARSIVGQVQGAGGDAWKSVAQHYSQFSPAFQSEQSPTGKKTAAETAKLEAEVSGTLPPSPAQQLTAAAQQETARHNKEMERIQALNVGREQAAQAETARHNRAMEAANNPLAALTAGAGGQPPVAGQPAPAGAPVATGAPQNLTGDAFLKTLPLSLATEVKAYAEGRRPFPAGFALKSPYFQSLIQMVGQYDPSFDAINYNARAKTRQDFTSGKSAQTINALNTVAQHLDRLSTSADALNNSWSPTYNTVANFLSRQSGNPTVTKFETDKKAVVDELTRAWRQSGGSEGDIKSWSQVLDASSSPEQLKGAISEMGQLLEGKLSALDEQAKQGLGTAHDIRIVTPQARQVLDRIKAGGTATPDLGGLQPGHGRTFTTGPFKGQTWTIGADGQPKKVGG